MMDDGTAGLIAVTRCGGVTVVQDPRDAAYSGMPLSALDNATVDYCVSIAEMGPPNAQASVAARDETALRREYCCADMQSSKCPASRHQIARQLQGSMSLIVKVCGWRPHDGGAAHRGPAYANLQGRKPREGHGGGAAWAMGI